jgi:hypothetical protein
MRHLNHGSNCDISSGQIRYFTYIHRTYKWQACDLYLLHKIKLFVDCDKINKTLGILSAILVFLQTQFGDYCYGSNHEVGSFFSQADAAIMLE